MKKSNANESNDNHARENIMALRNAIVTRSLPERHEAVEGQLLRFRGRVAVGVQPQDQDVPPKALLGAGDEGAEQGQRE